MTLRQDVVDIDRRPLAVGMLARWASLQYLEPDLLPRLAVSTLRCASTATPGFPLGYLLFPVTIAAATIDELGAARNRARLFRRCGAHGSDRVGLAVIRGVKVHSAHPAA